MYGGTAAHEMSLSGLTLSRSSLRGNEKWERPKIAVTGYTRITAVSCPAITRYTKANAQKAGNIKKNETSERSDSKIREVSFFKWRGF
jgi:hypothetical protein